MSLNRNQIAFLSLVRAGLWEKVNGNFDYNSFHGVNWQYIYQLSEEQTVIGLVTAGLDLLNVSVPQESRLQFIGATLQIEQRNKAMNQFVAYLVEKMREAGIYTTLVKGQAVAQCYERPLWRNSGDVDFFLSKDNYEKAKVFLLPLSSFNKPERLYSKEQGMSIGDWYVEIHGTLRSGLSSRIDKEIDKVQRNVFYGGSVRSWNNSNTLVFIPAPNEDVFFVFTHFIKHFYRENVNLRQLCDWCRLLWIYRDSINALDLEKHLRDAGILMEWKVFSSLAVDYLSMSKDVMLFYEDKNKWHRKANVLVSYILAKGNKGRLTKILSLASIFPWHVVRFLPGILFYFNWLKLKEISLRRDNT